MSSEQELLNFSHVVKINTSFVSLGIPFRKIVDGRNFADRFGDCHCTSQIFLKTE